MPNFKSKNYDVPEETRVCRNIECLRPLAPWQKYACSVACFHAYRSQKAAVVFICEICHKRFTRPAGEVRALRKRGVGVGRFCSCECALEGQKNRPNASVLCGGCGRAIDLNETKYRKSKPPKYHDQICMARAYTGRKRAKYKRKETDEKPVDRITETLLEMEGFIYL
jgi:hypothetical protein